MNRFSNNGISVFFLLNHMKIFLLNSVYEIPVMKRGKKWNFILKFEFATKQTDRIEILNGKELKKST